MFCCFSLPLQDWPSFFIPIQNPLNPEKETMPQQVRFMYLPYGLVLALMPFLMHYKNTVSINFQHQLFRSYAQHQSQEYQQPIIGIIMIVLEEKPLMPWLLNIQNLVIQMRYCLPLVIMILSLFGMLKKLKASELMYEL